MYIEVVKGLFNDNFHLQQAILGHASEFIFEDDVKSSKGSQVFMSSQSEQDLLIFFFLKNIFLLLSLLTK